MVILLNESILLLYYFFGSVLIAGGAIGKWWVGRYKLFPIPNNSIFGIDTRSDIRNRKP